MFEAIGSGLLLFLLYVLLRPIVRGACYFPTHPKIINTYLKLSGIKPGKRIVDLGSGDGRVLIHFARRGFAAHGYEINPILVHWSRLAIRLAGCQDKALVHWQSLWTADLAGFDAVIIYGFPHIMKSLGEKLKKEVRPGVPILSNNYAIPGWKPVSVDSGIYMYKL